MLIIKANFVQNVIKINKKKKMWFLKLLH